MTNIKDCVFELTKEIKKNPKREAICNSMEELHRAKNTAGSIGYLGRNQYKQFLGYLSVYQHREQLNSNINEKIGELPHNVLEGFVYGHNYIRKINELCLSPLADILPKSYQIIDPYWEFDYKNDFKNNIDINFHSLTLLTEKFHLNKAFKILKKHAYQIIQSRELQETENLAKYVYGIKNDIERHGLKKCPDEISDLILAVNSNTPKSIFFSLIFSLLYIHSSLQCIDQILFQSFIDNKLLCLNSDNIYKISHWGSNFIGQTYEICTTEPIFFCGDIVFLEIPIEKNETKKQLCIINAIELAFSQDFGHEAKVGLRGIDENFSAYENLIKHIII